VSRKLSAVHTGRSSVLYPQSSILFSGYCRFALRRLDSESGPLFSQSAIEYRTAADLLAPAPRAGAYSVRTTFRLKRWLSAAAPPQRSLPTNLMGLTG